MNSDQKKDVLTGKINYRGIAFTFVFTDDELRLMPPKSVIEIEWKLKPIRTGVYTFADPTPVDEKFIIANCNETNRKVIFLPKQGCYLRFTNSVVIIDIKAIIVCKTNKQLINCIAFSCPEINYIYPTNQAFALNLYSDEFTEKGTLMLSTQSFESTTTEKQTFIVDDKEVQVHFSINRTVSTKICDSPLSLQSVMLFNFVATDDYDFVLRLWQIALSFIRFLCYRKNIYINDLSLWTPSDDGKNEPFGNMFIFGQDDDAEETALQQGRYIKQIYIKGKEGKILSDIAADSIYMRHIPDSYQNGRHINAARFVMITAAFEWEFRRLYPNGIKKSEATIDAENKVYEAISELVTNSRGKQKEIYKHLRRLIRSDSLQSEIIQVGKDFSEIIEVFGNHLYHINNEELKYSEMGQRIANQRNHFAHGDLDKDFIGLSLLDLMFMEYVIYAMQLRHYEVDDKIIQKSINDLFKCGMAL